MLIIIIRSKVVHLFQSEEVGFSLSVFGGVFVFVFFLILGGGGFEDFFLKIVFHKRGSYKLSLPNECILTKDRLQKNP